MPFTLHHGPASLQKNQAFHKLITEKHFTPKTPTPFVILTSGQNLVKKLKTELLKNHPQSTLMGESVMSWSDFLIKLIKTNHQRLHVADTELCLFVLWTLMQTKFPNLVKNPAHLHKTLTELFQFFIQIKSCGLGPKKAKQHLQNHGMSPQVFELFETYQNTLKEHHYFDNGDLLLNSLQGLKSQRYKIWDNKLHIYVFGTYPLLPGHRDVLRELHLGFPELTIEVFYDESFEQESQTLAQAYEDLGKISDHTTYHEATRNTLDITEHASPHHEIDALIKNIDADLANGLKPKDIAIVTPSHTQATLLQKHLKKIGVTTSCFLSKKIFHSLDTDDSYHMFEAIPLYHKTQNSFLKEKLKSQATLEDVFLRWEFCTELFHDTFTAIPKKKWQHYQNERLKHITYKDRLYLDSLVICPLNDVRSFSNRKLYITSLSLDQLSSNAESSLYSPYLQSNPEFQELLNTASQRLLVNQELLKQILGEASCVVASSSQVDDQGKSLSRLTTLPGWEFHTTTAKHVATPCSDDLNKKEFFQTRKKKFSVSALQEYIKCPYRYYANYHLNINALTTDSIEADPAIKGHYVHKILQRLVQENLELYLDSLEYSSYRKKLIQKLMHIIDSEAQNNQELKDANQTLTDFYHYRVYKTIIAILEKEAKNHQDKCKQTTPQYTEWGFGLNQNGVGEITGRIDRIDIHKSSRSFAVIDYKTGSSPSFSDIEKGEEIQLPLYIQAVQNKLLKGYKISGAYYYGLADLKIKGFTFVDSIDKDLLSKRYRITEDKWKDIQNKVQSNIQKATEGIHQGDFSPNPNNTQICRYCAYKRICGGAQ